MVKYLEKLLIKPNITADCAIGKGYRESARC